MADVSEQLKVSLIADAQDLNSKIQDAESKLKIFKSQANQDAQIKLRVNIAELESQIAEARKRLSQFRKDGDQIGEVKTRLEISGLQQNKNTASKILRELQSDVSGVSKGFFNLNQIVIDGIKAFSAFALVKQAVETVVKALTDSFDAAIKYESAFAGIKKTVNATQSEFAKLSDGIIELSKTIPASASDLARIGESAGQLGVKQKDILEFTKTIAAIGVATNLSQEEAATSFARIANIYQEPIDKVSNLASSVVALGNNFATTETEIVNFTTRIAGAGKIAGLSTADLAGISTAFTSVGIEAEAGGTAVAKTLQSISDAVINGGKDLTNFAAISGLSAKTFAELWRSDPAQALNAFIQGLGQQGEKASGVLDDLVASDARLKRAFLGVASAGDLLTRSIDLSKKAFSENNALTTEASKRYETTESKLAAINNRWTALQISIGNFLKVVAVPILDFFVSFAEAIGGQENYLTGLLTVLKPLVAPFVLLGKAIAYVVEVLTGVYSAFDSFMKSLDQTSVVVKILSGALAVLSSAIGYIINPLGTVSQWLVNLIDHTTAWDNATKDLKKTLTENFQVPALDSVSQKFQKVLDQSRETKKNLDSLGYMQGLGGGNLIAPTDKGGDGTQTVDQARASLLARSKEETDALKQSTADLASTFGMTQEQVTKLASQLDLFNGATTLGADSEKKLREELTKQAPIMAQNAAEFESMVNRSTAAGLSWEDGIAQAVEAIKSKYDDNVEKADDMVKATEELYVANVAKTKDLGTAAGVAYGAGFTADEARRSLEAGVGKITDQELLLELRAADIAGDNGKAAGLLLALGFGDSKNLNAVATSGKNLNKAILNTFAAARPSISATGANSGATLVAGIINGINSQLPSLSAVLSRIAKALGSLSSFAPAFNAVGAAVIGADNIAKVQNFFGSVASKAAALESQYKSLAAAGGKAANPYAGGGGGGGGGGGAAKGLDEAKKKAEEAQKAVDEFTKSVESNNKASEKLRDNILDFYRDIVNAIDKAREKQADLQNDLNKFNKEQDKGLAEDAAKRAAELTQKQIDLDEKLKSAKKDLEEITANSKTKTEQQDILEYQTRIADKNKEIAEIQKEITSVTSEQADIIKYQKGLTDAQAEAQKRYDEALKSKNSLEIINAKAALDQANLNANAYIELQKRQTLSQFAQTQLEVEDKKKAEEEKVAAALASQQKIIDINNRFLQIENAKTAADQKAKLDLIALATSQEVLTQQQKQEKLKALGFDSLTVEQANDLLAQAAKANSLEVEFQKVQEQQQSLLLEKQKFQDLAQKYHDESVDKMKEKEQELIDLIQTAQAEQIKLNALKNVSQQASNSINTTNLNITNNNSSNVDVEAANRKTIAKIK